MMTYRNIKNFSYSISLLLHLIILLIFALVHLSFDYPPREFVELSFGISGEEGSSGSTGDQLQKIEDLSKPEEVNQTRDNNPKVEEVELPKSKNTEEENIVKPADKEKEKSDKVSIKNEQNKNSQSTTTGAGNNAMGEGTFGYDIDWGGNGTRKIYSYVLPEYPDGVSKEIDIRLRFTILPDGTVGTIFPLTKADTRLENAAINSLRQWRFEALAAFQKQLEQKAVIVFPYRLQ